MALSCSGGAAPIPPLFRPGAGRLSPLLAVLLAACAGTPAPGPEPARPGRDGASDRSPAELAALPDAEPRVEPLRVGGPNKPYTVLGQRYTPLAQDVPVVERGLASWYGRKFHGLPTASGEIFDMHAMTAAHRTMPLPSYARVRNPRNGREIIVRVNDRGPFHPERVIDLSYAAAVKLGVQRGVAPVEVERLTHELIRSGAWRREVPGAVGRATADAVPALPVTRAAPVDAQASALTPAPAARPVLAADPSPPGDPAAEARPEASLAPLTPLPGVRPGAESPAASAVAPELAPPAPGFWLQFGAFRERLGAERLLAQLRGAVADLLPGLGLWDDRSLYRVHAGPYASLDEAQARLRELGDRVPQRPVITERR